MQQGISSESYDNGYSLIAFYLSLGPSHGKPKVDQTDNLS